MNSPRPVERPQIALQHGYRHPISRQHGGERAAADTTAHNDDVGIVCHHPARLGS